MGELSVAGDTSLVKKVTSVSLVEPRTHRDGQKPLYTDYCIVIKTSDIAFHRKESSVRRRYSEFAWLRDRLATTGRRDSDDVPTLPPKAIFGRFEANFIEERRGGLERFLQELLAQTVFLSDLAVQLFVQTLLSTKDIDSVVSGETAYADDEDLEGGPPARGLNERRDTLDELATREAIRYGPRED